MCPNEIRDVSPLGVRGFIQFHALKDFATPGFESDPRSGEVPKKPNNHHLGGAGIHYYSSFNHFYVFIDIHDTSIHPSIHRIFFVSADPTEVGLLQRAAAHLADPPEGRHRGRHDTALLRWAHP